MARVLITGGAGFIGSHLARRCLERGDTVTVVARESTDAWRLEEILPRIGFERLDLKDKTALALVLAKAAPEAVFHLASEARRPVRPGLADVQEAIDADLTSLAGLLAAAASTASPPYVLIRGGSLAEYGAAPAPYLEDQREAPQSTYGAVMACCTMFQQALQARLPFAAVTARLALTYGPAQSSAFLVPQLIENCLAGRPTEIARPDDRRDLIHVDDVADALIALASKPEAVRGRVINVATGIAPRMREVADLVVTATGADPALLRLGSGTAEGGTPDLRGDPGLAAELLGWQPSIGLTEGIGRTVDWARRARAGTEKAQ